MHLSALTILKHLFLSGCLNLTQRSCRSIAECSNLQILSLSGCQKMLGGSFAPLRNLQRLELLCIDDTSINDDDLAALLTLRKLNSLHINRCNQLTANSEEMLRNSPNVFVHAITAPREFSMYSDRYDPPGLAHLHEDDLGNDEPQRSRRSTMHGFFEAFKNRLGHLVNTVGQAIREFFLRLQKLIRF